MSDLPPVTGPLAPRGVAASLGTTGQPAAGPAPKAEAPPSVAAADVLTEAVRAAAARQDGLAALFADLAAALRSPALPAPLKTAVAQVLAYQLPGSPPPTAAELRQAVARSGLFLEARLASGAAPAGDLKSALVDLVRAFQPLAQPGAGPGQARPPPAPPFKGGPVHGQVALNADFPADAPLPAIAERLARHAEGALDRQLMMQAASTPERPQRPGSGPWLFELPLATPAGPSIAQFEIDRDDGGSPRGGEAEEDEDSRLWRARFSLDLHGMGPVHARLTLGRGAIRVGLWAEDPATQADLDRRQGDLRASLLADNAAAEVHVGGGAPAAAIAPPGRFTDRAV